MTEIITSETLGRSGASAADLEAIKRAGQWMPWAGLGLAVIWWASVAITVVTSVDRADFESAGALAVLAAIALGAVPGMVVLFAGYVAREGARRTAASNLIIKAASQLLNPSKVHAAEAESLAASLHSSSTEIDRAMETALSAIKSLATEMGDERLRLESVTYAAADNARDLSARLADERAALETLTRDLKDQADTMGEIIPQQAAMMLDAARSASFDMAKGDEALEQRIQELKRTSSSITTEFSKIDGMAHSLQKQGDTLVFAVSRLETKLEEAQKTVEDAMRAGDAATDATSETGKALSGAVNAALDHARKLNAEINASARHAGEEASRTMAELRYAAEQAAIAVREAGTAAREEGGVTEKQLKDMVDALNSAAGQLATSPAAPQPRLSAPQPAPTAPHVAPQPTPATNADAGSQQQPARPNLPTLPPAPAPAPDYRSERDARAGEARNGSHVPPLPPTEPAPAPPVVAKPDAPARAPEAAEPKPILPPPSDTADTPQTVTLTSTRTAGFAQPSSHRPMATNLNGGPASQRGEPDQSIASPPARREAPRPDAPLPVARPASETPASPTGMRQRPRLDATPKELEAELFGGDDMGGDTSMPTRTSDESAVEENLFHANPRNGDPAPGRAMPPRPMNGRGLSDQRPTSPTAPPPQLPTPARPPMPPARGNANGQDDPVARAPARSDAPLRGRQADPMPPRSPVHSDAMPAPALPPAPAQPPRPQAPPPASLQATNPAPGPARLAAGLQPAAPPPPVAGRDNPAWSSILNDMDREETGQLPREETAESVIRRLETSGIALSNIFRPKAKKKIAAAARKGEQSRRAAIVSAARTEVDRVSKRLVADPELAQLAEDFVTMEEPDAIAALDRTQKSGRNASPRLSAFLLLDAATSGVGSPAH